MDGNPPGQSQHCCATNQNFAFLKSQCIHNYKAWFARNNTSSHSDKSTK